MCRQVVLLDEKHGEAAAGRVACDAGAVNSAADDEEVVGQVVYPAVATTEGQLRNLLRVAVAASEAS